MNNLKVKTKLISMLLCIAMVASIFTACGQSKQDQEDSNKIFINSEYQSAGMLTINKNAFDLQKSIIKKELGFGLMYTDAMQDLMEKGILKEMNISKYTTMFLYISEEVVSNGSQSGLLPEIKLNVNAFQCFAISKISDNTEFGKEELEQLKSDFENVEALIKIDNSIFYFAYNGNYEKTQLTDKDKDNLKLILSDIEIIENNVCLFSSSGSNEVTNISMSNFNIETIDGKEFSNKNFADYDITMVNIWSTGCGPCIDEMPELQELYHSLPDNVNMITICTDAKEEMELAKRILEESGCKFDTLIPDEQLQKSLLEGVIGYPTTIFVDNMGNVLGEPQCGVPDGGKSVKESYLKLIQEYIEYKNTGAGAAEE